MYCISYKITEFTNTMLQAQLNADPDVLLKYIYLVENDIFTKFYRYYFKWNSILPIEINSQHSIKKV